ncbi:nuclear transport factor 2 family protein [Streptomyces sp. 110]|uniref:Nuclear transport factor 2 family protein n=1 Tax=Streptomyces endocoffeicus TaxID=2898945 RepID=A0ABS1PGK0_9ACTN|nr:nuclear transport factor 2 family protein [Streptomyces endocoffeicus]MBL1111514.1 nuclear transport factor 2 family protein [Streptomyces endocoffeicus]
MTDHTTPLDATDLPDAVKRYLKAHNERDASAASTALAPDATVVDDGNAYEGIPAIERWLGRATSEFTYTTTFLGAEHEGPDRCTVTQRLEGDFPGGTVDLRYRFTLHQGLISHLTIAP